MARKSKATLAAEAAAKAAEQAETQELGKIEVVDGEKVVTDLEPASKEPVAASVDANGEDLGDVSTGPVKPAENEADEGTDAIDPTQGIVDDVVPTEAPEPIDTTDATVVEVTPPTPEEMSAVLTQAREAQEQAEQEAQEEAEKEAEENSFQYELEDGFLPILRPTMVGDKVTGHIPCPKAVFEAVQVPGWQKLIDGHQAKHALKSIVYWKNINGSAVVRCMSSSKFADVV